MQVNQSDGRPLEERLRGLALTGSGAVSDSAPLPNMLSNATRDGHTFLDANHPAPKGGRKRPNQAQRRQMSAELSIPMDHGGPGSYSSRQYALPQHYNEPQSFRYGQQQNPFSSHTPAYSANLQTWPTSNDSHSYGQTRRDYTQPSTSSHQSGRKRQQYPSFEGVSRGAGVISAGAFPPRDSHQPLPPKPALYNPGSNKKTGFSPEQLENQAKFLDKLCFQINIDAEIQLVEIAEKEIFRKYVENICREVVARYEQEKGAPEFSPWSVELKCFGSLTSGFATKASDMDLGLLSPMSRVPPSSHESPIPRLIEGALLAAGFGARLLTKTRVPIIKLCQHPSIALQQNLQDARKKWERGVYQEERDLDDDVADDPDLDHNLSIDADCQQAPTKPQTSQLSGSKVASTPEEELFSLKQSWNQSLAGYYNTAKRLLRRLNGRDITQSNYLDFTNEEYVLLDRVADAFIKGLHDTELRDQVLAYPSCYASHVAQLPNYRSLSGVHTIVEGQTLVLSWKKMEFPSRNPKVDQAYAEVVERWRNLQYSKSFGTNPVWFNKELQAVVETLRQFSPLQMTQLQQDMWESPEQYHERTNKIAITLWGSSIPDANTRYQVIQHYINGIRAEDIRNQVRDFVASSGTQALRTVAREHKSLHLATNYERALEKGLYGPEEAPFIKSYISILRRKPVPSMRQPVDFEYLIPIMKYEMGILDYVKRLPDPATLGPNKPRDGYGDSLEFPKHGVGVQCDINFSAHLALQNTLLLRCYSYTDPRVKPLVLFVKHWAKTRGINTPYRGTLSSYGYVLMVLHYLVNIVEPFVCPNLQQLAPPDPDLPPEALEGISTCQGYNIRFWRDEQAIQTLAEQGLLNQNQDSFGSLLRGFFEYYAQNNMMISKPKRSFDWGRDVLSLRTYGGLLSKTEKGWTGAKTVTQPQNSVAPATARHAATASHSESSNGRMADQLLSSDGSAQWAAEQQASRPKETQEIRHRFLFAIEDPFEIDHNVARTVTHNGIVSIRNEFRRAWTIIKAAGNGFVADNLFEDIKTHKEQLEKQQFMSLLKELHGNDVFENARG